MKENNDWTTLNKPVLKFKEAYKSQSCNLIR